MRNSKSNLSVILGQVKTLCRIVLTGTPLQNNLMECELVCVYIVSCYVRSKWYIREPSGILCFTYYMTLYIIHVACLNLIVCFTAEQI